MCRLDFQLQDLLYILACNDTIKKGVHFSPTLVSVSLDFDAYFPSLDIGKCASLAEETVANSNVEVECDTNELALFIACTHSVEDIKAAGLTNLVHKRRFKHGTRPGMTCAAITGGPKARAEDESWLPPSQKPTPRQKMKMLGK